MSSINVDYIRYNQKNIIKSYFMIPGFKYMLYFRLISFTSNILLLRPLNFILKLKLILLQHKYGIQIPFGVKIGKGFYIGHFGDIVVNGNVVIGENVNISHGVTIGVSNRGNKSGCPIIGDRVYIGPGAKIFGKITIGNDVAIGANAVVLDDVPDNACVAGVPAKIISFNGSKKYINNQV